MTPHRRSLSIAIVLAVNLLFACVPPRGRGSSATSARTHIARLVVVADSLALARRYQEASANYARVLTAWPESLTVAKRALGSFWRAARYEDAYRWGQRALAREPSSLAIRFDLGVTCGFLIELECVESVFSRAIELDSSYVYGYGELAFLEQGRGNVAQAIRYMEAAYAAAPQNDFSISGLAQMLIPAGQAARARALMESRLAANRRARAYGGRSMLTLYGWALLAQGDTAAAYKAFNEVLQWLRDRESAGETTYQLFRERAAIHALRGDRDSAVTAMRTAFERGWRLYVSWSLADPMFATVADDPAVRELVERMRRDVRETRRRLQLHRGG